MANRHKDSFKHQWAFNYTWSLQQGRLGKYGQIERKPRHVSAGFKSIYDPDSYFREYDVGQFRIYQHNDKWYFSDEFDDWDEHGGEYWGREIVGLSEDATFEEVMDYLTKPRSPAVQESRERTIQAKQNIQEEQKVERDLLSSQNAEIMRMIDKYDTLIQSNQTMQSLMNQILESAKTPSVIQTLYLDRQAKTYLPTTIKDRGFVGASQTGGQSYG